MERDLPAAMRDGVVLRADVYRPEGDGPFPIILTPTPYNRSTGDGSPDPVYEALAATGYVVAAQDVQVPVFHRTGWYDRFVRAIEGYRTMAAGAGTTDARTSQRLMVGPWGHTSDLSSYEDDLELGPDGLLKRTAFKHTVATLAVL